MSGLLCELIGLYVLIIFASLILSWFPTDPQSPVGKIRSFLWRLTDPLFRPLRSVIPPVRIGSGAMDLSPLIVLIGLQVLRAAICG
ncbi:MAG: YggT family protein [Acidimicrobiales bacterium]